MTLLQNILLPNRFRVTRHDVVFYLVVCFYWIGVLLYDLIDKYLHFTFVDELLVLVFFFVTLIFQGYIKKRITRISLICIFILCGYLVHSYSLGLIRPKAIWGDAIIVAKPIIAALTIWELKPQLNSLQLRNLRLCAIIGFSILILIGISGTTAIYGIYGHPSRFATAAAATAMLYLFASRFTAKNIFIFLLILSLSLISQKAKAFGFFVVAAMGILYLKPHIANARSWHISPKLVVIFCVTVALMLFVARHKIIFYFVTGTENTDNMFARPALYYTSIQLFKDFFPLGTGFGSFASYYSGLIYSPLYHEYGLSHIHGLTESKPAFVADTFFPEIIGQFGVIGILLTILAIVALIKKTRYWHNRALHSGKDVLIIYLLILFFLIESLVDSTILHNRGAFLIIILTLSLVRINRFYRHAIP